jgi:hypothetical protein
LPRDCEASRQQSCIIGLNGRNIQSFCYTFRLYGQGEGEGVKNIQFMLLVAMIVVNGACSDESLKRTGYETLQNVQ